MEIGSQLHKSVITASARAEVCEAVSRIYEDLQREIDQQRPVCVMSGKCCRFEEYGHRLYVTTAELAAFTAARENGALESGTVDKDPRTREGGCPFQVGRLCGVHDIRPMGCRVFFCDPAATEWQREAYERMHRRLKKLHEELSIPYAYVEWRLACGVMGWCESEKV